MKLSADLHTHTAASGGQYTPAQLVELAQGRGLDVLTVTDHDTIAGTAAAIAAGKRLGLRVIRGVDIDLAVVEELPGILERFQHKTSLRLTAGAC